MANTTFLALTTQLASNAVAGDFIYINDVGEAAASRDKRMLVSEAARMIFDQPVTNTANKTFNDTTFLLRNVADTFNGSFVNTNTANRIYTLQDAAGTIAFTSDITGTNSGTNTGDQTDMSAISDTKANFNTALSDGTFLYNGVATLPNLLDVTSAAVTNRFALMADGAAYVGRAIVEADVSDLQTYALLTANTFTGTQTFSGLVSQIDLGNTTAFGFEAGLNDDLTSNNNAFFGFQAGKTATNTQRCVAVGAGAFDAGSGGNNTVVGFNAGGAVTIGTGNTAVGQQALATSSSAANNCAFGNQALVSSTGAGNMAFGPSAGSGAISGADNIIIGNNITVQTLANSNQITIGNLLIGVGTSVTGTTLSTGRMGIGVEPTANMTGLVVEGGAFTMKEITTPTADTDYGKIYTKTDNKIYFQDGAGVEHEIAFV